MVVLQLAHALSVKSRLQPGQLCRGPCNGPINLCDDCLYPEGPKVAGVSDKLGPCSTAAAAHSVYVSVLGGVLARATTFTL